MDHAINAITVYFEISMDHLYDEWKSGEYKRLSDCPTYRETSTYREAINVMKKFYYGNQEPAPLEELIDAYIWRSRNIDVEW
jgi:hypothetical protein